MAAGSLLALLDDIASVLDDISTMTTLATKKTAGVVGDDLALNAEQVADIRASRELPVIWAVAKGSIKNKLILVPAALLISAFIPWAIMPLLMLGGIYLCYEGVEKLFHKQSHPAATTVATYTHTDAVATEQAKIQGAIRTDFVLSIEIIVLILGTVADQAFITQAAVISLVAVLMTVLVYGLVALIVRLDDIGITLSRLQANVWQSTGKVLLFIAPRILRLLSMLGTIAMFMVGGGIMLHTLPFLHHLLDEIEPSVLLLAVIGIVAGLITGAIAIMTVKAGSKLVAAFK